GGEGSHHGGQRKGSPRAGSPSRAACVRSGNRRAYWPLPLPPGATDVLGGGGSMPCWRLEPGTCDCDWDLPLPLPLHGGGGIIPCWPCCGTWPCCGMACWPCWLCWVGVVGVCDESPLPFVAAYPNPTPAATTSTRAPGTLANSHRTALLNLLFTLCSLLIGPRSHRDRPPSSHGRLRADRERTWDSVRRSWTAPTAG